MMVKDHFKHRIDFLINLPSSVKTFLDSVSIASIIATFAAWLPAIATLLSILWTLIRIYETRTVQRLLGKEYHRQGDVSPELERANKDE